VAIYNGMGGGAAAAIAAVELIRGVQHDAMTATLLVLGAVIGSVAFSGSCVAFAKLQGIMKKAVRLPGQNNVNFFLTLFTIGIGLTIGYADNPGGFEIFLFFVLALALGVVLVMPIGGADMPVVISLLNAFTDFAAQRLHRSRGRLQGLRAGQSGADRGRYRGGRVGHAADPAHGQGDEPADQEHHLRADHRRGAGSIRDLSALDAASLMRYGQKVIIVPGYGMAVAGAQHKVWEMAQLLEEVGLGDGPVA